MYVKDLTAGKLDSCAQVGRFVGYDSESKGYQIYWPHKCSVTVEQNVIFNEDDILIKTDTIVISGNTLAEGEIDKVIQHSATSNLENEQAELQQDLNEPENQPENPELPTNSIPFTPTEALPPESLQLQAPREPDLDPQVELNTGCGHRACHPPGHYAKLNKGLETNFTAIESDEEVENADEALFVEDADLYTSPFADYALGISLGSEPKTLDEALHS